MGDAWPDAEAIDRYVVWGRQQQALFDGELGVSCLGRSDRGGKEM